MLVGRRRGQHSYNVQTSDSLCSGGSYMNVIHTQQLFALRTLPTTLYHPPSLTALLHQDYLPPAALLH
jgi:hypothetical protein